jgi:hypothetical protein
MGGGFGRNLRHGWSPDIRHLICNRQASGPSNKNYYKSMPYTITGVLRRARPGQRLLAGGNICRLICLELRAKHRYL